MITYETQLTELTDAQITNMIRAESVGGLVAGLIILIVAVIVMLIPSGKKKNGTQSQKRTSPVLIIISMLAIAIMTVPRSVNAVFSLVNPDNYSVQIASVTEKRTGKSGIRSKSKRPKKYYIKVSGYNEKISLSQSEYNNIMPGEQVYIIKNENFRLPGDAIYNTVWQRDTYTYNGTKTSQNQNINISDVFTY